MGEIQAVVVLMSRYDEDGDIEIRVSPPVDDREEVILLDPNRHEALPEPNNILKVRRTWNVVPGYEWVHYHEVVE